MTSAFEEAFTPQKRRLQWRRNQRNCRERKRRKERIEYETFLQLKEEILYYEKINLYYHSNTSPISFCIDLLTQYYHLFQHGIFTSSVALNPSICPYCPRTFLTLQSFEETNRILRTKTVNFINHFFDTKVSFYLRNLDEFWMQWRAYSYLFDTMHIELLQKDILYSLERDSLIRISYRIYLKISQRTLLYLFPSMELSSYIGKTLELDGYTDYYFHGIKVFHMNEERQIIPCLMKGFSWNLKTTLRFIENEKTMDMNGWIGTSVLGELINEEMYVK